MNIKLSASLMCADFTNLSDEIKSLNKTKIDSFHCDIMDGCFVPNIEMGMSDLQAIKTLANKNIDYHLMIQYPSKIIDSFIKLSPNTIYVHFESEPQIGKLLQYIKSKNIRVGIAINPDTSLSQLENVWSLIDELLIMTVYPGFAGQKYLDHIDDKINEAINISKNYNFTITLDGACSPKIINKNYHKGIHGFVLGTSSLFKEGIDYNSSINKILNSLEEGEIKK